MAVAFTVLIALAGNIRVATASVEHSTRSGAGAWAQHYCSGPWYQFPYLLWIVGPLTAAAALAGVCVALSLRWTAVSKLAALVDPRAAGLAAFIAVAFVSFASFFPHLQYLRILSPAAGSYCLLAGLGLWFSLSCVRRAFAGGPWGRLGRHAAEVAMGIAIVAAGIHDYRSFTSIVVRSGMEELSVFGIRLVMHR